MSQDLLRRATIIGGAVLASSLIALPAGAAGVERETADVVGQGPAGAVVSEEGATIQRSDSGISVKLSMPTPEPGSYVLPPAHPLFQQLAPFTGHPEVYSLWVFAFNFPALCSPAPGTTSPPVCDSNDLGSTTPAKGGAFNGGGHVVGGPNLNFAGRVSMNTEPLFDWMSPLLEPRTAEVHLAVAPHGAVQPDDIQDQLTKPVGAPAHWWLAIFD